MENAMRTLLCTTLAALVVIALAMQRSITAQDEVSPDTLQAAADESRLALLTGTPEAFSNSLAPWIQERVKLYQLEQVANLDAQRKEDAEFAARHAAELKDRLLGDAGLDPAGMSGLKTLDDSIKAKPEAALAIEYGYYRLRGLERLKDNIAASWFVVDRVIGTETDGEVTRVVGQVHYCSAGYRDSIEVRCVRDESGWQVVDVVCELEDLRLSLSECAMAQNPLDAKIAEAEEVEETRAEAEDLLRAMRDYARVHWSKNQQVPKSLNKDAGVHEDALAGDWHKVRDEVYKQPGANRGALVAEPAHEESFVGWALISFDYDGGESLVTWYESEKELDDALDAFQTEK
jgi:hypothetical protein